MTPLGETGKRVHGLSLISVLCLTTACESIIIKNKYLIKKIKLFFKIELGKKGILGRWKNELTRSAKLECRVCVEWEIRLEGSVNAKL